MALILILALVLDFLFGEPSLRFHPTVWFGKAIGILDKKYRRRGSHFDLLMGLFCTSLVILFAVLLSMIPYLLPSPANLLLGVYLLKTTFSIRSMYDHVVATLGEDRKHAVQKLVSRDVSELSDPYLNSATIESVAENTVDGFIAPIFYFVLFGLTGAMVYRAVNTLDAMVGYRDQRYEYFGKFAARLDDVLTFIPSRISVLLYFPFKPKKVWKYYRMAKFKINGDKPVACMSAVLGVWLEKKGVYRFEGRKPEIEDVKRALKVFLAVVIEWAVVCTIILGLAITSELDIFRKLLYSMRV